jgi:N-hydroxyarylamine O-acetyltransferase
MNVQDYLSRIGYSGPLNADFLTLRALQRAHLYSVPFENLDIGLQSPIRVDEDSLFDKIVRRRRGGFCYELNGLFAYLLEALGFHVVLLSAAGANDDGSYAHEFDHLLLQVHGAREVNSSEDNGPWLVDVGWGNGPLEPLQMLEMGVQRQGDRSFKIVPESCWLVLTEKVIEEGQAARWIKHYAFTLRPRSREEFDEMCQYHQISPESIFTQKRICSLYVPGGRVSLSKNRLITTRGGSREERDLADEGEVRRVLKDQFGIDLGDKA